MRRHAPLAFPEIARAREYTRASLVPHLAFLARSINNHRLRIIIDARDVARRRNTPSRNPINSSFPNDANECCKPQLREFICRAVLYSRRAFCRMFCRLMCIYIVY